MTRAGIHKLLTHFSSGDLEEDGFHCGLAQSHSSGNLHLSHITQILGQETQCLQKHTQLILAVVLSVGMD